MLGGTEPLAEVGWPDLSVKRPPLGLPDEVAGIFDPKPGPPQRGVQIAAATGPITVKFP